jgi:hypothetical protein
MANSHRRSISYTPRMTDEQAYERCPPTLRKVLQESVNEWSAYGALRYFEKHGLRKTVEWLRAGDEQFMRKGFIPARGKRKAVPSTYVALRVKPLRLYDINIRTLR